MTTATDRDHVRETSQSKDMDPLAALEALLMSADRTTPGAKLGEALAAVLQPPPEEADIESLIAQLNEAYDETGRAFRIEAVAGGYRVMTRPEFAGAVAAMNRLKSSGRLSRAALETLSIIAYRQPVTRASLEAIRGVACGEILRALLERRLIMIKGRAEELGRPMLYGTTKHFLDVFGLASLKDLPKPEEFGIADSGD